MISFNYNIMNPGALVSYAILSQEFILASDTQVNRTPTQPANQPATFSFPMHLRNFIYIPLTPPELFGPYWLLLHLLPALVILDPCTSRPVSKLCFSSHTICRGDEDPLTAEVRRKKHDLALIHGATLRDHRLIELIDALDTVCSVAVCAVYRTVHVFFTNCGSIEKTAVELGRARRPPSNGPIGW